MSQKGLQACRGLVAEATKIAAGLTDEQWRAPSAATGWTVQDVFTHMAFFFHTIADPQGAPMPDDPPATAEALNDAAVAARRDWTPQQTKDYYATQSVKGLSALTSMQRPELRAMPVPLAELGVYRASDLSDAVCFDHVLHLGSDVLAPHGPVGGYTIELTEERMVPTLDWMCAGLPQMCAAALAPVIDRPLGFDLTGVGARRFTLERDGDRLRVRAGDLPADVVRSTTTDFIRWATTRQDWRGAVEIDGDEAFVSRALAAIDIV